jgi:hypothetical protein
MMKKFSIPTLALTAAVLTGCGSLQADNRAMAPEWPNVLAECDVATKVHQYSYGSLEHCAQQAVKVAAQPQVQWPEGDKEAFLKAAAFSAIVADDIDGSVFGHTLRSADHKYDISVEDKEAAEKELTPLISEALHEVESAPVTLATDGRIAGLVGDKYVEVGENGVEVYDPKSRYLPDFGKAEDIAKSGGEWWQGPVTFTDRVVMAYEVMRYRLFGPKELEEGLWEKTQ